MAMNPSTELPQPSPSFLYMLGPARGRKAPNSERDTVRAATPEAANVGKESIVYVWMGMKMPIMPKPKGIRPITRTIHWNLVNLLHRIASKRTINLHELLYQRTSHTRRK
jgi:hypothetical protein